ncbi:MAG: cyclic 2,3-diphosphoglycerate synthase [Candidatus Thermoplasmatota archaeon]|jgi:predicted GTPase|nr:cyclic 2,3-diphosphoglycerate synthase [Candidatus Thermoplasmatota archaeon]
MTQNVLIMGAAGRDFHNFNTYFRDRKEYNVVGFTATQIPNIEGRTYPKELAGKLYPKGIPIYPESDLTKLIKEKKVDLVVFSYSDVPHEYVMHKGSEVLAAGANYLLLGPRDTQVKSKKPLISICAVRTGSGKSQTTRRVEDILIGMGKKVVAIRHPMPYGNLLEQKVQRFATMDDMVKQKCTIEEREEYEPHIKRNVIIYAGVDYEAILRQAEKEGDIVLWDGGNNDFSFYKSDLQIVVADPHRAGHEVKYHPGEVNLRSADVIVINKEETATLENINIVRDNIRKLNPKAIVVDGASPFFSEDADKVRGKRVLAIEDGPTLTHGEMSYGAAVLFSIKYGASELVDSKEYAKGTIKGVYEKYKQIHNYLPAMGYSPKQVKDLEATINATPADVVVSGTPIDLTKVVKINKPLINVKYELQEIGKPDLTDILAKFVKSH